MSVTEAKNRESVTEDTIEFRLNDIVKFLKDSRRVLTLFSLIAIVIGVIYAFIKPDLYNAQVTVLPEFQTKNNSLGGLSSLAGLAGIDINSTAGLSTDAIRPDIYPDILRSAPFALAILEQPVYSRLLAKETSLKTFLEESDKQCFASMWNSEDGSNKALKSPENISKIIQVTGEQEQLINQVHESVSASFDKKTGVIAVSATLPDPVVAATVARLSLDYLTNYITSYRTEKARDQVRFLGNQVAEAKNKYQEAEYALSNYRDRNQGLYLNTAKIEEQRLQSNFLLTQNVFNELSKQLEQAKIKVSEESPVFKILEPAKIPLKKSAPKRGLIITGFLLVGVVLGIFASLLKLFIKY